MDVARPTVSVVIPAHNRSLVVSRAIDSALTQTYQPLEIIVVDDGSSDNTREVVESIRDSRIRYLRHDRNLGAGAARNTGIRAATGDYVAFLDSDDEWMPQKLERQVQVLANNTPEVAAVCSGFVRVDEQGRVDGTTIPGDRDVDFDVLIGANRIGTTSTAVVKRALLNAIGGFDPALRSCQDWDMYLRLVRHHRLGFVPEVMARFHIGSGDRITGDTAAVVDGHLRMTKKYLEQSLDFPRPRRARHLYALGIRLVSLGYRLNARSALQRGRQLALAAFLADPARLRYLAYYLASSNRFACTVAWPRASRVVQGFRAFLTAGGRLSSEGD
jgi:glycosyltransferase involved in cell wall biosynthesis